MFMENADCLTRPWISFRRSFVLGMKRQRLILIPLGATKAVEKYNAVFIVNHFLGLREPPWACEDQSLKVRATQTRSRLVRLARSLYLERSGTLPKGTVAHFITRF